MLAAVSAFAQDPSRASIAELRRHKAALLEALQSPSAVAPSTGAAPPATAEAAELSELTGVDPSVAGRLLATASEQVRVRQPPSFVRVQRAVSLPKLTACSGGGRV
jgi:hypothetical protein